MTVDRDLGIRIKTVEHQIDVFTAEHRRSGRDCGAILPVRILDPLQLGFVVAVEGFRDQLVGQQIEVYIARNGSCSPLRRRSGRWHALAKLPAAVQIHTGARRGECSAENDTKNSHNDSQRTDQTDFLHVGNALS